MSIMDNYKDESLFSIAVKNLPRLTDADDFKAFLVKEYSVNVREVILLYDPEILLMYENKLKSIKNEVVEESKTIDADIKIEKIRLEVEKYIERSEKSGVAIVIFENIEDKLIFFREYFNTEYSLSLLFKKVNIYRGNKIYFELLPLIPMIYWANIKYALEKTLSSSNTILFISTISQILFIVAIFISIFAISNYTLEISKIAVINSIIKTLI